MKKILSVVLAGAMILGMSVSAFADAEFGFGTSTPCPIDASHEVVWNRAILVRDGAFVDTKAANDTSDMLLEAGDVLYFSFDYDGHYGQGSAPSNWKIKINNAEFVEDAGFYRVKAGDALNTGVSAPVDQLMVKVTLEDDFDYYEEDEVKFYFYLYDNQSKNESPRVKVAYDFKDYNEEPLTADDLNWVLTVKKPTTYKYAKGEKAAKATVDFNDEAYAEFKMYSEEKYTLSSEVKYNKNLSKEYDTDVEIITFRMKNVENADILFPASKDNKQIVAVVDGELVPVDAEYVKDHKFESGKKANGYLVEDAEYTQYAVIDKDVEIEVEEDDDNATEEKPSTDKQNPAMGANDFVGAAVALAVVSVAAAGALALKK